MKTFLNVLYRRILYKIPLKFLLIMIAIFAVLFASFSNANEIQYSGNFNIQYISNWNFITPIGLNVNYDNKVHNYTINCQFSNLSGFSNVDNFQYHLRLIRYISPNGFNNTEINNCVVNNNNYNNFTCEFSGININSVIFNKETALTCTSPNICGIDYTCRIISDNIINNQNSCNYSGYLTEGECNNLYSGYIFENDITQNYCTNKYNNLIPNENIDSSYCENNGLCTICGGSGEINTGVNWSSLFLNGEQINSNAIIDITTDDRLNTNIEYLNDTIDIDIGFDVDYQYIENVKNNEKLTPTNEDVAYMIQGLQVYIPYLFIGLIMIFTIALIRRFFRG